MKDNYEKIFLGVAAVIAIAMVVLGVMKLGAVEEEFPAATENPQPAIPFDKEVEISQAVTTLSTAPTVDPVRTAAGREVEVFTGVDLFVRKGAETPVDIGDSNEKPVHPPIPNSWWLTHGMGDEMGYGNAPQRDFDEDGFSNGEEFEAKTAPNDKSSFPSLFAKVRLASVEQEQWYLRFSNFGGGSLSFRIEGIQDGKKAENRMRGGATAAPGDIFFADAPYQNRFKFVELKQVEANGIPKDLAVVEDQKEGKAGKVYEIPAGSHQTLQSDYTARLYLDTPAEENNVFEVEEGMSFSLPYDENAQNKPYTLKEIGGDGTTATLLWDNNGETQELELKVEN
ncbi:Amuc_1099 family pilus-like system protein [Roseibacillus ishigakijimensis]|uniref:Uncharacterized protein n=1 Tax=Roseibacillus ishigakijimensis TaxID=454146 RepID=A0A934RUQ5_9BACT|nr:Amuc_1099 family pilus-like system protein [Roseibacillus ishigakijimensis]MBK1834831.1 hypothetical protein [Roseibacillus ishigakijimensis]